MKGEKAMNITVIYGQHHKGNTWRLANLFLEQLDNPQITEYYLPQSAPAYCLGCLQCMYKGEQACPHATIVQPIVKALDGADLIIVASPCYVLGMTGQLKALFDHLAYRHMAHRPEPRMFQKQALVLSTAAGMGMGKTTKAIADNLFYWGVAKIYRYGIRISAADFEHIPRKRKLKIERQIKRIARKVQKNDQRAKAGLKTRLVFSFMKLGQKHNNWNPLDKDYWQKQGWL